MVIQGRANICIDCERACGGCSWSEVNPETGKIRFEPVPGWTAEPVYKQMGAAGNGYKSYADTYRITACPLFLPDKRQHKRDNCELTVTESLEFLTNIRSILRRWADE